MSLNYLETIVPSGDLFNHTNLQAASLISDVTLSSALRLQSKENSIELCCSTKTGDLQGVLDKRRITKQDLRTLCNAGKLDDAISCLDIIDQKGIHLDLNTYAFLLRTCTKVKALKQGRQVHGHVVKAGKLSLSLANTLVNMYAKCGSMLDAHHVFEDMQQKNVVTWTMMIAGYVQQGDGNEALKLYEQMQQQGLKPDDVAYVSIITACANVRALECGKHIHSCLCNSGLDTGVYIGNALICMYAKGGRIIDARRVFNNMHVHNLICWNTMIAGYEHHGNGLESINLFQQMQQEGVTPDNVTYVSIFCACSSSGSLNWGRKLHWHLEKSGLDIHVFVGCAIIGMYIKCGSINAARRVFDKLITRDVVLWNAIIAGYSEYGDAKDALSLFRVMQQEGFKPNQVTYLNTLSACAAIGALQWGKYIHTNLMQMGKSTDVFVGSTLVDMYAKCGNIVDARRIFNRILMQNLVSWTAMISGYADHGDAKEALSLCSQMQLYGLEPDGVTYISVFTACSHVGFVNEGFHHFNSMNQEYRVKLTEESYACLVDLLSRSGGLQEAKDLIDAMPLYPDAVIWKAFLAACKIHNNEMLAECAVKEVMSLDPNDGAALTLLSNVYAGRQARMKEQVCLC